jgi:hypothetical protein
MTTADSTNEKKFLLKIYLLRGALSDVPLILYYVLVIVLILEGFFDFLYSWPLVLSYLFFFLPTALILGVSTIISRVLISPLILRRYCTRRFLRLVCTIEASKTESESLLHVKDVIDILSDSVGAAMIPFAALVLMGLGNVYPPDVFPLVMALLSWTFLWRHLVWLMSEIMKYRYAEGLSFRETLQELTLYPVEKKFGSIAFESAVATLAMYWMSNAVIAFFNNPPASFYHIIVVLVVSVATPIMLAVVVGWVLDVFIRRLFGEALGKFLFATFVVGAVFHPSLGVLTSFLFSWALFGKARDAAAAMAIATLSLFAVMLPGLILTSVLLLWLL